MSETREKARALLAAATPVPWDEHEIHEGLRALTRSDHHIAAAHADGLEFPSTAEDAALIAAAPTLLATLCDEADASERRAVEAEAAARLYAERRVDADRRADEAEAGAAAMRELALFFAELAGEFLTRAEDAGLSFVPAEGIDEKVAAGLAVISNGAELPGRATLDRLERAEAERDANRTAAENAYAAQLAAEGEAGALRAELEKEQAKVRRLNGRKANVCRCVARIEPITDPFGCEFCRGSGAVIVGGEA